VGGHREQLDKVFGPMHLESFSVSVSCNMWHDLAAVWTCPRNVMIIKRHSIRISLSPALIPLLRLQPYYRNHGQESWYSSMKTQSRLWVSCLQWPCVFLPDMEWHCPILQELICWLHVELSQRRFYHIHPIAAASISKHQNPVWKGKLFHTMKRRQSVTEGCTVMSYNFCDII